MRAVFLDRDGTINKPVLHRELALIDAPLSVEQMELLPGAAPAIQMLRHLGLKVVVVTNQASVAKGKLSEATLWAINDQMKMLLAAQGAALDGIYYCPHHPEEGADPYRQRCRCRKPQPGLLEQAATDLGLELTGSYMIGDSYTDILAGQAAGCRNILLGSIKCDSCRLMQEARALPDAIAANLGEAAELVNSWEADHANLHR